MFWAGRRRALGPPAGDPLGPAAPADRRTARRRARPAGAAHHPRGPGRAVPGVRGDVHRGGRRLAGGRRGSRALPRPGHASWSDRGWSFARFDEGRLVFKAEVACATPYAAQVQGVWVAPDRRGEGLAAAGMAAVVELVPARDRADRLALRQRLERRRPPRLRRRPGSARPRASPPSCSEQVPRMVRLDYSRCGVASAFVCGHEHFSDVPILRGRTAWPTRWPSRTTESGLLSSRCRGRSRCRRGRCRRRVVR